MMPWTQTPTSTERKDTARPAYAALKGTIELHSDVHNMLEPADAAAAV